MEENVLKKLLKDVASLKKSVDDLDAKVNLLIHGVNGIYEDIYGKVDDEDESDDCCCCDCKSDDDCCCKCDCVTEEEEEDDDEDESLSNLSSLLSTVVDALSTVLSKKN